MRIAKILEALKAVNNIAYKVAGSIAPTETEAASSAVRQSPSDETVKTFQLSFSSPEDPFGDGSCVMFFPFQGENEDRIRGARVTVTSSDETLSYEPSPFGLGLSVGVTNKFCETYLPSDVRFGTISAWIYFKQGQYAPLYIGETAFSMPYPKRWVHLVAPFVITGQDTVNGIYFINGKPFVRSISPAGSGKLIFGYSNGGVSAIFTQVRVFNRFLSLEEIALLYLENPAVRREDYNFLNYIGKPELLYIRGTDILDLLTSSLGFAWPSYSIWRTLDGRDAFTTDLYIRFSLLESTSSREVTITGEFELDGAPDEKGYIIKKADTSTDNLDVRLAVDNRLFCYAEAGYKDSSVATEPVQLTTSTPYRFAVRYDGTTLTLRIYDPKEGVLIAEKRVNLPDSFSSVIWNSSTVTTARVPGKVTSVRFFDVALTDDELDKISLQEFYVKNYKIPKLLLFGSMPVSDGIVLYFPMNKPEPEYKADGLDVAVEGLVLTTDRLLGYMGTFSSLEIKGIPAIGSNVTISFKTRGNGELVKVSEDFVLAANYVKIGSQVDYFKSAGVARHYCLVCEDRAAKLYVNGKKLVWSGTLPKALSEYQSLTVTASPLSELRIYKRVLNEDEVNVVLRGASFA